MSPHFDDAVLSMGDLIGDLSKKTKASITIINVFTKGSSLLNPLTKRLITQAGFKSHKEYFNSRAKEDKTALKILDGDVKIMNLGYTDAAWRQNKAGDSLYPKTTWGIAPSLDDVDLTLSIKKKLMKRVRISKDLLVFAPVGRGKGHVDHIIVRDIARSLFRNVVFYADFDYGQTFPLKTIFSKENKLTGVRYKTKKSSKTEAIMAYKTQLKGLFGKNPTIKTNPEIYYLPR